MIPVKIISSVEIPTISEDVLSNLIRKEILASNPELTITSIKFERKLSPQRVEASVEAHVSNGTKAAANVELASAGCAIVEEEEQVELPSETPETSLEEDEPKEVEVTTVADLFTDDD